MNSKAELDKYINKTLKCGRNQGDHNYKAALWSLTKHEKILRELICIRCFYRVKVEQAEQLLPRD